jgi:hypothetical protein
MSPIYAYFPSDSFIVGPQRRQQKPVPLKGRPKTESEKWVLRERQESNIKLEKTS